MRFILGVGAGLVAGVVFVQIASWIHSGEQRAVYELGRSLDGVEVIEVTGIDDWVVEDLSVDMVFEGERLSFGNVCRESFDDPEGVEITVVGQWDLYRVGYRVSADPTASRPSFVGGCNFGRSGLVGKLLNTPVLNIPDCLRRLGEIKAFVESIPENPPGLPLGRHPAGKEEMVYFAVRERRDAGN